MQEIMPRQPLLSSFIDLDRFRIPPRLPLQQDMADLDVNDLRAAIADEQRGTEPYAHGARPYGVIQNFFTDLCHSQRVDGDAFRYLLPFALYAWTDALSVRPDALQATGEFHAALFRKHDVLRDTLTATEVTNLVRYATATLNWFVDLPIMSESPTLAWVPNWVGLCCGLPGLTDTWLTRLRTAGSPGLINAYLSYVSRIAYTPTENPLFSNIYGAIEPWSRETFITPGCHWQQESLETWQREFSTVSARTTLNTIAHCPFATHMQTLVATDVLQRLDTFERRAKEVIGNLSVANPTDYWSDAF